MKKSLVEIIESNEILFCIWLWQMCMNDDQLWQFNCSVKTQPKKERNKWPMKKKNWENVHCLCKRTKGKGESKKVNWIHFSVDTVFFLLLFFFSFVRLIHTLFIFIHSNATKRKKGGKITNRHSGSWKLFIFFLQNSFRSIQYEHLTMVVQQ